MEVVTAVNVPFDIVAIASRRERLETMFFSNSSPLGVSQLLVFLVVAMVRIDQVLKFADAVLEVYGSNLGVVQVGIFKLVSQLAHETLVLLLGVVRIFGTVLWGYLLVRAHMARSS
jgi:hypothetical protein